MIGSKMNEDRIMLFNWDISHTSKVFQFMISVGGVISFYIMYGYLQELLFKIPGFKPFGWYLTFIQFACYTMFALVEQNLLERNKAQRRIPLKTYLLLAFLTVGTMGMSNASLGYLNYPTQVIFKCCKLIPVMLGGILIQGKRYGCSDFLSCLLMSVGLAFFILADSKVSPQFNYTGVLLISIALCADAAIGNVQEKYMKEFKPSNSEVVLYSYGIGIFYILLYLILNGSFVTGFQFFYQDVQSRYGGAVLFSLSGYLGITFVLTLIRCFGALATVTVTTFRKALTIMLSFIFFAKPFSFQYVWSGMIVLLGILLNIYQKNRETIKLKIIQLLHSKTRPAGSMLQQV